jgi:hypothetical protein
MSWWALWVAGCSGKLLAEGVARRFQGLKVGAGLVPARVGGGKVVSRLR